MAFFGTRIAKLKFEVGTLKGLLEEKEMDYTSMKLERNDWRKKYELAMHTPEYKLDAEAAFARGQQFAIKTVKNNLMFFIDQLPTKDEPNNA